MTSNSVRAVAIPLANEVTIPQSIPPSLSDKKDCQDTRSLVTGRSIATGHSAFSAGVSFGEEPASESEPGEGSTDKGSPYEKIIGPQTKAQVNGQDALSPKVTFVEYAASGMD